MKDRMVAVDVGATNISMALVDKDLNLIKKHSTDTVCSLEQLIGFLKSKLATLDPDCKTAVGLALPAFFKKNRKKKIASFTNLNWPNLEVKSFFSELNRNFFTVNDGDAAAWGSYSTEINLENRLLTVTLGTGVGGGIVIDDNLLLKGGEIGHLKVDPSGELCGCGSRGCLETFIGGKYIARNAREWFNIEVKNARQLHKKAIAGNVNATECWRKIGGVLGYTLSGLVNLFGFKKIIIGGKMSKAYEFYLDEARKKLKDNLLCPKLQDCSIEISKWKEQLTLVGTACMGFSGKYKERGVKNG